MIKGMVSVIIPVYNGEKYIGEAIQSVLSQTYSSFELIIVNDNSTDKTEEAILSYSDPRIRYYKNDINLGMAKNWNKGLEYARGEYIKVLCHDDILHQCCLEMQTFILAMNPSIALVTNSSNVIDSEKNILLVRKNFRGEGMYNGKDIAKKCLTSSVNLFGETGVFMFRKSVLNLSGGFTEGVRYAPDMDFCIRVLKYGDMYYIDETLSSFRLSSTNETAKIFNSKKLKTISSILVEDKAFIQRNILDIPLTDFEIISHYTRTIVRFLLRDIYLKSIFLKHKISRRKEKLDVLKVYKVDKETPAVR